MFKMEEKITEVGDLIVKNSIEGNEEIKASTIKMQQNQSPTKNHSHSIVEVSSDMIIDQVCVPSMNFQLPWASRGQLGFPFLCEPPYPYFPSMGLDQRVLHRLPQSVQCL